MKRAFRAFFLPALLTVLVAQAFAPQAFAAGAGKIRMVVLQVLEDLSITVGGSYTQPASRALAATLVAGNSTSGTSIEITSGDSVTGEAGGVDSNGGNVVAVGGAGNGTGNGGAAYLNGGAAGATGVGGAVFVVAADGGATSGAGGAVSIDAGAGTNGNADGGAVSILAGDADGAGTGGVVDIDAGSGGTAGYITIGVNNASAVTTGQFRAATQFGGTLNVFSAGELLSDLSSDATTATLVPAGATLLSVTVRVKTAVVTSSATNTFSVGEDGGDADHFGAGIAGAQGTTTSSTDYTADPRMWNVAAHGSIKLTPPGAETFSSGAVYVVVHYLSATGPTNTP